MSQQAKITIGVLGLCVVGFLCRGCGHYPKVSPTTYALAKALYSVCNREDNSRLTMTIQMVQEAEDSEKISSKEAVYLREIISTAQSGDWSAAEQMARDLMRDQSEL